MFRQQMKLSIGYQTDSSISHLGIFFKKIIVFRKDIKLFNSYFAKAVLSATMLLKNIVFTNNKIQANHYGLAQNAFNRINAFRIMLNKASNDLWVFFD